jgi:hypothetical protein
MGLRERLAGLAELAPVPVFVVPGVGRGATAQRLELRTELEVVRSPRAANVLLAVGAPADGDLDALRRTHDAVARPRAAVVWGDTDEVAAIRAAVPHALGVDAAEDPVPAVTGLLLRLLRGERPSSDPLLPDEDPAPWRGVGPYGQGGSGMTGGVPYGRPMAERADDRDGLALDQVQLRLGPFLPPFPPGLSLDVALQGDVFQEVAVVRTPRGPAADRGDHEVGVFLRALDAPVRIADLELARARSHLRWLARALEALELPALGARALRLALDLTVTSGDDVRRLARGVRRSRALGWATRGVGRLEPANVAGQVGPVARACGLDEDLRSEDPAYRELGFRPAIAEGGDAAARWEVRLAEVAGSIDLARRADDRTTEVTGRTEGPRGVLGQGLVPTAQLLGHVEALLVGMEWGDAVTTILSLDLDLDEIALATPAAETAG